MKPEYVGVGNFDEDNYVYAFCNCPLSVDYAIKWPRIKDGKVHSYTCTCEDCGTEVGVISKSYGPEVYEEKSENYIGLQTVLNNLKFSVTNKKGTGMTREEAIKELSYIADEIPSMEGADWIEAISMGIRALQQEPCTDAISRQAFEDAIEKAQYSRDFCKEHHIDYSISMEMVRIVLHDLPPVTPAEKVGQWEWVPFGYPSVLGNWVCSKCKNVVVEAVSKKNKHDIPAYKFCPQCGEKKKEVNNG